MGRRRLKKIKLPPLTKQVREALARVSIIAAVVIVACAGAIIILNRYIHASDYFALRSVESKGFSERPVASALNNEILSAHKYENIFDIDIRSLARSLRAKYPDAKKVAVLRALPDCLVAEFVFRKPVAVLRGLRYYPVDREGYLLSSADARTVQELPAISGVNLKFGEGPGRRCASENLRCALDLLSEVRKSRYLSKYRLAAIDAGDIKNLSFYLNDGLEIKIGYEHFKDRLALLVRTLKDPRLVLERIRYIDVRFDDAVVSPR